MIDPKQVKKLMLVGTIYCGMPLEVCDEDHFREPMFQPGERRIRSFVGMRSDGKFVVENEYKELRAYPYARFVELEE